MNWWVTPSGMTVSAQGSEEYKRPSLPPLGARERAEAAWVAAVRAVDGSPGFFETAEPLKIDLRYDDLDETAIPSRISDQDLRRYVARRLYLLWKEASFDVDLEFDGRDAALTGAGPTDFLRNLQLLQEEGYVHLDTTHNEGFAGFNSRGRITSTASGSWEPASAPNLGPNDRGDDTARHRFSGHKVSTRRCPKPRP